MLNVSCTESVAPAARAPGSTQIKVAGLQTQPVLPTPIRPVGVNPPGSEIVSVRPGEVAVALELTTFSVIVSATSPCRKVVVLLVYVIATVGVPAAPIGVSNVNCMLGVP